MISENSNTKSKSSVQIFKEAQIIACGEQSVNMEADKKAFDVLESLKNKYWQWKKGRFAQQSGSDSDLASKWLKDNESLLQDSECEAFAFSGQWPPSSKLYLLEQEVMLQTKVGERQYTTTLDLDSSTVIVVHSRILTL